MKIKGGTDTPGGARGKLKEVENEQDTLKRNQYSIPPSIPLPSY